MSKQDDLILGIIEQATRPVHYTTIVRKLARIEQVEYLSNEQVRQLKESLRMLQRQKLIEMVREDTYQVCE